MPKVTIVDYGIGNLLSVARAFQYCEAEVEFADSPDAIIRADRLVLPGVGAFSDGMSGLDKKGLSDHIKEYSQTGRPFLGICLGMQMMLDVSYEFGKHQGLGIIPGKVVPIPSCGIEGRTHKIPFIGWNELLIPDCVTDWEGTIFSGIGLRSSVYFVHSFEAIPEYERNRLAVYDYNGQVISAAIRSGNLYGCQFHPEKSGPVGLKIIRNFINL
ncbi:MAG: imidazole glycerol phosphate synthase [Peptococcaceae bacterium BICA1-7]|nr:MAG: imidazole glycerol phosphate synthase [Peptococcaceae bacterium BICA1-7]